jgi:hypothetical protein
LDDAATDCNGSARQFYELSGGNEMKNLWTIAIMFAVVLTARGQDKPRVFVQGKGSENTAASGAGGGGKSWSVWNSKASMDSHDESMEVTKDLQKNCSGVIVTLNQSNADYTVMLNRESKHNRGLLRTNSQVQVANKAGDVLGTNATHTVGNAAKDACGLIVADWQAHGRVNDPASASTAAPQAQVTPVTYQPHPAASAAGSTTASDSNDTAADAARKAKQHQACLDLAKDNPSIVCK